MNKTNLRNFSSKAQRVIEKHYSSELKVNDKVIVYTWHLDNDTPEDPKIGKIVKILPANEVITSDLGSADSKHYISDLLDMKVISGNTECYLIDKHWNVNLNAENERVSIVLDK